MRALFALVLFLLPSFAMATPALTSKSDSDDDARVSLTVERETIRGDTRSYCQINIRVTESRVNFSRNDKIFLWVKESDPLVLDDDTVWSRVITVQGRGSINQTFDCSKKANGDDNPFPGDDGILDDGNTLNLYAEARVEKDDCGVLCLNDRPSTGTIDVRIRTDDGAEPTDDMLGDNNPRLPPGLTTGRISRDADWYRIDVLA